MGNTRKKLWWVGVSRLGPSIRSVVASEFLEDKLPKDREPKALLGEPIENYTLLEEQLEQNVWVEA